MIEDLYTDEVIVKKPIITQASDGSPLANWQIIKQSCYGRLNKMSRSEKVSRGVMSDVDMYMFYCNGDEPIDSTCELWQNDLRYEVTGIDEFKDMTDMHHYEVYCRRIVSIMDGNQTTGESP